MPISGLPGSGDASNKEQTSPVTTGELGGHHDKPGESDKIMEGLSKGALENLEQTRTEAGDNILEKMHWFAKGSVAEILSPLRHQDPSVLKGLKSALQSVEDLEGKVLELSDALREGNFSAPIFDNTEEYPLVALKAVSDKKITDHQFGTLMQWYAAKKEDPEVKVYTVEGNDEMLQKTLVMGYLKEFVDGNAQEWNEGYYPSLLSNEKWPKFIEELDKLPDSEKKFFLVKAPEMKSKGIRSDASELSYITHRISYDADKNFFSYTQVDGEWMRIVPSFGMVQTFFNVRFGEDAIRLQPVIGLSEFDDIQTHLRNNCRDTAVHFPGIELIDEADGRYAPWTCFTHHDFYHAHLASGIQKDIRCLLLDIADKITKHEDIDTNFSQKCREKLIDMEAYILANIKDDPDIDPKKPSLVFWEYLETIPHIVMQDDAISFPTNDAEIKSIEQIKEALAYEVRRLNPDIPAPSTYANSLLWTNPEAYNAPRPSDRKDEDHPFVLGWNKVKSESIDSASVDSATINGGYFRRVLGFEP